MDTPTPPTTVLRFRLPHSYRAGIKQISAEEGMSVSQVLRMAIADYLVKRQQQRIKNREAWVSQQLWDCAYWHGDYTRTSTDDPWEFLSDYWDCEQISRNTVIEFLYEKSQFSVGDKACGISITRSTHEA